MPTNGPSIRPELKGTGLTGRQWKQLKAVGGPLYDAGDNSLAYRSWGLKSLRALEARGLVIKDTRWMTRAWRITEAGRVMRGHAIARAKHGSKAQKMPERLAAVDAR